MVPETSSARPQMQRVQPWLAWLPRSVLGVARSGSVIVVGLALNVENCAWGTGGDESKCESRMWAGRRSSMMARKACCAFPELVCTFNSVIGSNVPTALRARLGRELLEEDRDERQAEECEASDELLE